MKIALAQLNYTIGDFEANKVKIIDSINKAKTQKTDLVIFAESAICGTPAYDLLKKYTFLEHCEEALIEIASHCDDISVLVGLPILGNGGTAGAVAYIHNRRIVRYISKKSIATRDEKQYLVAGDGCEYIKIAGEVVAVVVGEDINGADDYAAEADIIVNLRAHPYSRGVVERRYNYYKEAAYRTGKPYVYINQVGGQTDVVYDGSSAAFNAAGEAIALLKNFAEDFQMVDTGAENSPIAIPRQNKTANVFEAMKLGLRDYFTKNGFTKACLGMSGGIDSAVVAAMAVETLGAENVRLLMMPSQFSSDHSVDDAVEMAERIGVQYNVVPITEAYKAIVETMKPVMGGTPFDVTEENIQARIRAVMLMALSNKFGYIVLNTSNKSEAAAGYGTLYGDLIGSFGIIGDLYKSEIYDVARYINQIRGNIIPEHILLKEPSAELHSGQKDSDSLPPYETLDAILYRMIEKGEHREEIVNAGFDAATVQRVHTMLFRTEYKRHQGCPVLRLSTSPLGIEFVMPLTNKYDGYGL
jgi:NAD+ synthase (glutamine-hydrolysing)